MPVKTLWKWMTGEEPDEIDHDNGVRHDNRWCNLNNGSRTDNTRNRALSRNNTTGFTGVYRGRGKYRAQMFIGNQSVHLGCFDTALEAARARKQAEREHGYHPNHGRSV